MSKLRKLVSLSLVLTIVLSVCAFSLNVTAETTVELNEYDYTVSEKLDTLGVVDVVENERLTDFVLRKEIVNVLMKYLLIDGASIEGETTPFIDVSIYDENIGGYRALKQMGYISGDENKRFRPDDNLTYNEAIKLIVSAMGYAPFAKRNGGYPAGYLYTANKYGLLTAMRGNGNNPIPFCDLYRLIEASLYADAVIYRYAPNEDDSSFSLDKDRTVLEEIYGYKYISGIVTGNENTRLYSQSSSKIDRYQIEIENIVYETPRKEYADLLGKSVHAYAKRGSKGDYEIIYMDADPKNNEFELSAKDILKDKTTATRIYYEDENYKQKSLSVKSPGLSVIYNGKRTGFSELKDVIPSNGYILGIDNSGDKVIDVLFVYEYVNYVARNIDTYNYIIYDEYDSTHSVTLDSNSDEVRIYDANGQSMAFSDIVKGDVLSVMKSKDTSDYEVILVYNDRASVSGTISEIIGTKYIIDGVQYEIADSLSEHIANSRAESLSLGVSGTFYLDHGGKIAHYVREATTDGTYGVLAGVQPERGLENSIKVRIFAQDSTWIETEVTETVKIDGTNYRLNKTSEFNTIETKLNEAQGQVVLFKTGSNNRINYIDRAEENGKAGELNKLIESSEQIISRGGMINLASPWRQYTAKPGQFILFRTPEAADMTTDTENWVIESRLSDPAGIDPGSDFTDYVLYNLGGEGVPRVTCVLFRGGDARSASISHNSSYYVITGTTTGVDEEGNIATKLYYSKNGAEQSAFVKNTVNYHEYSFTTDTIYYFNQALQKDKSFAGLELGIGDIIQFGTNADGYISTINVVYRNNTPQNTALGAAVTSIPFNNTGHQSKSGTIAGTVKEVDAENKLISIETVSDGNTISQIMNTTSDITIYRIGQEVTEGATLADIMEGDTILVRSSGGYSVYAAQFVILR